MGGNLNARAIQDGCIPALLAMTCEGLAGHFPVAHPPKLAKDYGLFGWRIEW